jgi:hypothetical protein
VPDLDFFIFLYTTLTAVFMGKRQLAQNRTRIPRIYNLEEISLFALTREQNEYLEMHDRKLAALHYQPVCTYRFTNLGHNLMRSYICPGDKARCVLMLVEHQVTVKGVQSATHHCVTKFTTLFPDSKCLVTRNMKRKALLDHPPGYVIQECPTIEDPAELKRRHDARVAGMNDALWPPSEKSAIFAEIQRSHQTLSEYRSRVGNYQLDDSGNHYMVTDKTHWRGIRNHFNPFAQRVPALKLLLSIAAGSLLPLSALLLLPRTARLAMEGGLDLLPIREPFALLFYLLAGALIGYVLEKGFLWGFVLTYPAVHIVIGWTVGPIPYSTIAGIAAFYAMQFKMKRQLILMPEAPV